MKLGKITCIDCGTIREVLPQDIHQVKRCEKCQAKYRKVRREELRKQKEQYEIDTMKLK